MASNVPLKVKTLLLVVCLSVLLPQPSDSATPQETIASTNHRQVHGLEIGKISASLSDKGYLAMSIILQGTLSSLLPIENTLNDTAFTIFCPPDKAFFTPKYPQPPLTLIQYHIVHSNLGRESLESSLEYESKIDTLLHGHPLVVTTTPHSRRASINDVKVTEWNIYNDGRVIVHGVEEFFDPAFQTLLYPWYDIDINNESNKNGIKKSGVEKAVSSSLGSATSWVDLFFGLAVFALAGSVLCRGCFYEAYRRYSEYQLIGAKV